MTLTVGATDDGIERTPAGRRLVVRRAVAPPREAVRLPFEVTSCRDYRWTWDVARIAATGHVVESHPAGAVVGFELPVLAGGYAPVCARACGTVGSLASGERGD